jgi:hypothetical protein
VLRNFVTPIIQSRESVRSPARIRPYPTGRFVWDGAGPGTSCQATIAPSLRDISQRALARCCSCLDLFSVMSHSSSSAFRLARAKLPPLAFSIHRSFILANRPDPQSRTIGTLNTYSCRATIMLSLWDTIHSPRRGFDSVSAY